MLDIRKLFENAQFDLLRSKLAALPDSARSLETRMLLVQALLEQRLFQEAEGELSKMQGGEEVVLLWAKLEYCRDNIADLSRIVDKHHTNEQNAAVRQIHSLLHSSKDRIDPEWFCKQEKDSRLHSQKYRKILGMPVYLVSDRWVRQLQYFKKTGRDWPPPILNLDLLDMSVKAGSFISDCRPSKVYHNTKLMPGLESGKHYHYRTKPEWEFLLKTFGGLQVRRHLVAQDIASMKLVAQDYPLLVPILLPEEEKFTLVSRFDSACSLRDKLELHLRKNVALYLVSGQRKSKFKDSKPTELPMSALMNEFDWQNNYVFVDTEKLFEKQRSTLHCNFCKAEKLVLQYCQCKKVLYCGKDCQEHDRGSHLALCKQVMRQDAVKQQFKSKAFEGVSKFRGAVGLRNVGNTCYMNSALQVLSHIKELTQYFLSDSFQGHINVSNPLGTKGNVAFAYAKLIRQIWQSKESYITPSEFKSVVGKHAPQYKGYNQQDSSQFLLALAHMLHQDLNLVKVKPYEEEKDEEMPVEEKAKKAWSYYESRNRSIITQHMVGQFITKIVCPTCNKVSITFDPYIGIHLPLSKESKTDNYFLVTSFPQKCVFISHPDKITSPDSLLSLLKEQYPGALVQVRLLNQQLKLTQNWSARTSKHYVFAFINKIQGKQAHTIATIKAYDFQKNQSFERRIALPTLISCQNLYAKLLSNYKGLLQDKRPRAAQLFELRANGARLIADNSICDLSKLTLSIFFLKPVKLNNYESESRQKQSGKKGIESISLEECLQAYNQNQVLDKNNSWYCPACKAFKEAEMSQRIYSAPNILFVCLKRFKKSMSYGIVTSKLNTLVKFPLKRLDLTPFLHCGRRGSYDLIGVINHYGSIGGGHYTAFCFNEHEGWLEFDDSSVRKRTADDVNTAAAYVLVYRFRPQ